jgi:tRNA1Val (adenine37-N6)-methyltransferase
MPESAGHTNDGMRRYGLQVSQPVDGYRFSLDALLLSDFVRSGDDASIIDLGTGCGIIPLILARRFSSSDVTGVDSNSSIVKLAETNILNNDLAHRIKIKHSDVVNLKTQYQVSCFDGVVANPPFRSPLSGKLSPKPGRDQARHESTAGLTDFLAVAKYLVKPSGRIFFVYLADRLPEFIHKAAELKLTILRLRMVHGFIDAPAKIFLVELVKGRKGATAILPPLIIYERKGEYTLECQRILDGGNGQKKALEVSAFLEYC